MQIMWITYRMGGLQTVTLDSLQRLVNILAYTSTTHARDPAIRTHLFYNDVNPTNEPTAW
jgi:hypothetical protein